MVPWEAGPDHCRGAAAQGQNTGQLPDQGERPEAWLLRALLPQQDQRGQPLQVSLAKIPFTMDPNGTTGNKLNYSDSCRNLG